MFKPRYKTFFYILLIFLPFYLFFIRSGTSTALKFPFVNALAGPARFLRLTALEIKKIIFYHSIFDEYTRLRAETGDLKSRLRGMEDMISENSRLEKLLAVKRRLLFASVGANVIGRDPSLWNAVLVIDKGANDGVAVGFPVIHDSGVVGKIAEVSDTTSKVALLTDPQFSVAALVRRPRESGLVSGALDGTCRMSYLRDDVELVLGDEVVTSKLSAAFPENLLLGTITAIVPEGEKGRVHCVIKPAAALAQIEEVLVIIHNP
ncbi:MAG: rod shape-determining protein MreC [Candidatus Omnitrophica bacterium]|nr:rod shape-determining protein MreC [Candidatus Omnitrophota bacterium]